MQHTTKRLIEAFLRDSEMPPTTFGRLALGDPRFVLDLRNGRIPRDKTMLKAQKFITAWGSTKYVPMKMKAPRRPGPRRKYG